MNESYSRSIHRCWTLHRSWDGLIVDAAFIVKELFLKWLQGAEPAQSLRSFRLPALPRQAPVRHRPGQLHDLAVQDVVGPFAGAQNPAMFDATGARR